MTREDHLKFCTVCQNRKFDSQLGLVCGLTNQYADFENSCEHYSEDTELKAKQEAEQVGKDILLNTASLSKRLANYLLDIVFYYISVFLFGIFLGIALAIVSPHALSYYSGEHKLMNYVLAAIIMFLYYVILESTTGRSIAKFITKTKVVDERGEKPDFKTIVIRTLCRFIPFEAFSFLFAEPSGWHDTFSKTKVINA